jgi:2-dehydro-3-deoxy-D-arabinonate dehydratase
MLLYRTEAGTCIAEGMGESVVQFPTVRIDALFRDETSIEDVAAQYHAARGRSKGQDLPPRLLPPIESQEVWAAGVTYQRSRTARMEESSVAGASDFYAKVYAAHRPELFFKATPHRVVGHGQPMSLRQDSTWMVPEPELVLAFSSGGALLGYTIGNDLSCRDIEAENPLYLPQAKIFNTCAALGPALLLTDSFPSPDTEIRISIERDGSQVFSGTTKIAAMKQSFANLQEHLFRHNTFPNGCYLMTGTGIVPDDDFALRVGDRSTIMVEGVGILANAMQ